MIKVNGEVLHVTQFPDGTSQVWKLPDAILEARRAEVEWIFYSESEFMQLAQLKMLLDRCVIPAFLRLPYLPYGRQDKKVDNESTFALCTFSTLLNTLKFKNIIITDPHSDIALELIERSEAEYPTSMVEYAYNETNSNLVCYPDKGALSKYRRIYAAFPMIYGEKVRDQLTGNIQTYEVIGDPKGKNVLIVDDICDGGMTFKILAKDLLESGAKKVSLFVTHGIFSKGVQTLKESGIDRIFTKDKEIT